MAKRLRPPVDQPAAVITARATAAAATAQTRESHMADLAALRADHPGLLALEAWLRGDQLEARADRRRTRPGN